MRAISTFPNAIAGEDFLVHCPYSGYPIESIRWQRAGQEIVSSKEFFMFFPFQQILKF